MDIMVDKEFRAQVTAVREWLGPDGLKFFRDVKEEHGEVNVVLTIPGSRIPHPIHFREGMQIRNVLRKSGLCKGWSDHDLDDRWAEIVEQAIS